MVVETGTLNQDQQSFWKTFYTQGLGEFFYTNKISPHGLINFLNGTQKTPQTLFSTNSTTPMVALG
ncbi:MAG: hypothetical protein WCI00_09015 [bacterium]